MKVTKGHFNRRVLFFGLLLFLAISLISTGFASWIMSTGADKGSDGNVHVGTITDGSLEFGEIIFVNNQKEIIFDAKSSDTTGDIKADLTPGAKLENLSITLQTTINPAEYVQSLSISVAIPDTVKNAADAGYITMPSCCYVDTTGKAAISVVIFENGAVKDLDKTGISAIVTDTDNDGTYDISITLTFGWGTLFGGENPGEYLDKQEMLYKDKVQKMIDFKRVIYGLAEPKNPGNVQTDEVSDEDVLAHVAPLPFDILLTAVAK